MHDVDHMVADSEEAYFVKIHVREGSDRILGAIDRCSGTLLSR
jgi:pyruvate/2-oxoglutarate dehydrogenase complex dihydrolipoamide dehydrogenase (E3) component